MRPLRFVLVAGLMSLLSSGFALAQDILVDGDDIQLNVPGSAGNQIVVNTQFVIDTPIDLTNLFVSFDDQGANRDIDVLLREVPFSDTTDAGILFGESDFYSGGAFGNEFVNVSNFVTPSVEGKRWYVALLGFPGAAITARLQVEFDTSPPPPLEFLIEFAGSAADPDCLNDAWDDSTPFQAVGGNNATTLGEARRNAMTRAMELLGAELTGHVPINVRACWQSIESEGDGFVLARAGSNSLFTVPAGRPQTFYSRPAVVRLSGTDFCQFSSSNNGVPRDCNEFDLFIEFNDNFDQEAGGFDYSLESSSSTQADFIQVAMHELTHGLGFLSLINDPDGALGRSTAGDTVADIYSVSLGTDEGVVLGDPATTDAERAAAIVSVSGLVWLGEEANTSLLNNRSINNFGDARRLRLYAPADFSQGSSVSHVDLSTCTLMNHVIRNCGGRSVRTLGVGRQMLNAVGWQTGGGSLPYQGLLFDPERDSHGFDMVRASTGADPLHVLTFYTFDDSGNPEWRQALGRIRNGTFEPQRTEDNLGNGLAQFVYDFDDSSISAAAQPFGMAALSYNRSAIASACNDGFDRPGAAFQSAFQWEIGSDKDAWCTQSLIAPDSFPATDFGGLYFDPSDSGWGMTIENFEASDGTSGLFVLLYVYAADGSPVWYLAFAQNGFVPGQPITMDLFQRQAFARIGANNGFTDTVAGSITFNLTEPPAANEMLNNTVSLNVTYQGPEGGDWVREDAQITRLSQPR